MPISIIIEMAQCAGCCGPVVSAVVCRTRTGSAATLCGLEEFYDPSVPPKKYRRVAVTGNWATCNWTNSTCNSVNGQSDKMEYLGQCEYDISTCATTNSLERKYALSDTATPCGPPATAHYDYPACNRGHFPNSVSSGDYSNLFTRTRTKTTSEWAYPDTTQGGPCAPVGSAWRTWSGIVTWTLSNEDTIFHAIDRVTPGSWTSYSACSTSATTSISARAAGDYDSTWQEGQVKVSLTGLVNGAAYTVTVTTEKRITGSSDAWVAGPSVQGFLTATGTTGEIADLDLPFIDGYEVRVDEVSVVKD